MSPHLQLPSPAPVGPPPPSLAPLRPCCARRFSYSALISACGRAGRWQQAEQLFWELQQKATQDPSARPNTVTYSALISAYEKGGQLEKALAAFRQQLAACVEPDLITYSSLISACERAGAWHGTGAGGWSLGEVWGCGAPLGLGVACT